MRLYLPIIASTLIYLTFVNLGVLDATRPFKDDKTVFRHMLEWTLTKPTSLFSGQMGSLNHWIRDIAWMIVTPITYWNDPGFKTAYNRHLWTLPVEFFASITLFTTMFALAGVRNRVRVLFVVILVAASIVYDWWALTLFWSGWLLVELNTANAGSNNTALPMSVDNRPAVSRRISSLWRRARAPFHIVNFLVGLYLLSAPEYGCQWSPFYRTLCNTKPWRLWATIGAVQTVASISNAPFLAKMFTTKLAAYLGRISFSLYLLHGIVNHVFGVMVFWASFTIVGQTSTAQYYCAYSIAFSINTMAVVWAADLFMRVIDDPSVKLGKKIETWCFSAS